MLTRSDASRSLSFLRASLALIFFCFGFLKLFPRLSPAEALAGRTLHALSFGLLSPDTGCLLLAVAECTIGIALLLPRLERAALACLLVHLAGTFAPFLLFPRELFLLDPPGVTLTGQYILKNLVLIGGGLVLWAVSHPVHRIAGRVRAVASRTGRSVAAASAPALLSMPRPAAEPESCQLPAGVALRPAPRRRPTLRRVRRQTCGREHSRLGHRPAPG
jgi:uncharacterized membrane protein YphA (DoxX/SURF4 family)